MKKMTLIATLITLLTITANLAMAMSVSDVTGSSLTSEQKTEVLTLMKDGKPDEAEVAFNKYAADAELAKMAKEAQRELEKTWTAEVRPDSMTYDKCIDDWCDDAGKAYFLQKRWNLDDTIWTNHPDNLDGQKAALHEAINTKLEEQKQARERARIAHLEQLVNVIALHNTVQDTLIAKAGNIAIDNAQRLDTVEQRLTDDEFDMAAALRELAKQAKLKDDDVRSTIRQSADDIANRANNNENK